MKRSTLMILVGCMIFVFIQSIIIIALLNKDNIDIPLTNEQVIEKAIVCDKKGKAIQMVYDEEWQVFAVKCVESGLTSDGRRKKSK